jgi:hypothetical protein
LAHKATASKHIATLIGGFNPFETYDWIIIPTIIEENKTCSKPPTRTLIVKTRFQHVEKPLDWWLFP